MGIYAIYMSQQMEMNVSTMGEVIYFSLKFHNAKLRQQVIRQFYFLMQLTSCRSKKSFVLFSKTIVFNALIPNILLSWLSDEQKCIFFRI